jgi:hypothetical protein
MRRFVGHASLLKKLFFKDRWFIGIRKRSRDLLPYYNTDGYFVLRPPPDRFYADPFLFKFENINYLFFEDYRYEKAKGIISVLTVNDSGSPGTEAVALERPYHLSFPFVFAWAGEIWMIPETSSNQTIELYRAKRFPEQWILETVLMNNLHASDSVVLFQAEKCWLFTSIECKKEPTYDNLSLFYSNSLLEDWQSHPLNPVVVNPSRARPAGMIFAHHDGLIRPGQDCTSGYGHAIQFNHIDILDEDHYQESTVQKILPGWAANCAGTHTYNQNEDFEVLDGYSVEINLYGKWLSLRRVFANSLLGNDV